jgi:sporulation protein YlmC with PRC-barrel domain
MRVSKLLGLEVVSEGGRARGRLFDLRVDASGPVATVSGLVVGAAGARERLFGRGASGAAAGAEEQEISWEAVKEIDEERKRVVVAEAPREEGE